MNNITFLHPSFFYLLIIIPIYIAWYIWKQSQLNATIQISTIEPFAGMKQSWKVYLRHVPVALRMLALASAIVVLARPQ